LICQFSFTFLWRVLFVARAVRVFVDAVAFQPHTRSADVLRDEIDAKGLDAGSVTALPIHAHGEMHEIWDGTRIVGRLDPVSFLRTSAANGRELILP
jgi:hypothetical protein